jgi:23S rRNA-/tRNA-specific pseudouridylate synthase
MDAPAHRVQGDSSGAACGAIDESIFRPGALPWGMQVVFENEAFVAVDKPAGWLSVPGRAGAADPRPVLGRRLEAHLGTRIWPIHRLDEEVSGLVLFARNAEAHAAASRWFEQHVVAKTYEAFTEMPAGERPEPRMHVFLSRLLRGKKRAYEGPHGKPSETRATPGEIVTRKDGTRVLPWTLQPITGRPHQLRYELSHRGFPVLGDTLYGARTPFRENEIALRCVKLDFLPAADVTAFALPRTLSVTGLALD